MMNRTVLSALVLLSACSSGTDGDELAGEADHDDGDGKSDTSTPGGASSYFAIRGDARECVFPACGGYFLDRLNATKTTCHDRKTADSCYVPELDWSQSNLNLAQQLTLTQAASGGADGVAAIVRGKFMANALASGAPEMGRFVVTEAWVPEGKGVSAGVFAKILDNGRRCAVAPCPHLTEKALNSSRSATIHALDFDPAGYDEATLEKVGHDLFEATGLIIAGERYSIGTRGKGRTVTVAYRNLMNVPESKCVLTGCGGTVCADQHQFTTCEARPDDVCYKDAICEPQADGHCGFTETAELTSCLASH